MKNLLTITLALCAFMMALACGGNDPEIDGVTGATEQPGGNGGTAKGKMNGQLTNGLNGIYIQDNQKYIGR